MICGFFIYSFIFIECVALHRAFMLRWGASAELRSVVCFASPLSPSSSQHKRYSTYLIMSTVWGCCGVSRSLHLLLNSHQSQLHCWYFPQSAFHFIEQSSPMKQFCCFPFSMFAPKRFIHRHNIIITTNKNSFKKEKKKNRKWNGEKCQTNYEEKMYVMWIICLYCKHWAWRA